MAAALVVGAQTKKQNVFPDSCHVSSRVEDTPEQLKVEDTEESHASRNKSLKMDRTESRALETK